MKTLSRIGLILSLVALAMTFYFYFSVLPAKEIADFTLFEDHPDSWFGSAEHTLILSKLEFGTDFAIYTMFAGCIALIINSIALFKKQKIAWIGIFLSLIATIVGLAYGTHMFS